MTDKITEFRRINEPRAMRMLEQLGHIQKSAASMKIDASEVGMMLAPVRKAMNLPGVTGRPVEPARETPVATEIKATPPVSQAGVPYADLPTTQLVDKMIAIGAILAERRK